MTRFTAKICVVGDFAVGKTSTVERFVNNHFSEKYLTTIGVKVDTKDVVLDDLEIKLILWDIAGSSRFGELELAYLRGAAGFIVVADGTRPDTIESAKNLRVQIEQRFGPLPYVMLLNKSDLRQTWELTRDDIDTLTGSFENHFVTSAKSGENVEQALTLLASLTAAREIDPTQ